MKLELTRIPLGSTTAKQRRLRSYEHVSLPDSGLRFGPPGSDIVVPLARGSISLRLIGTELRFEGFRAPLVLGPCLGQELPLLEPHSGFLWVRAATNELAWPADLEACKAVEAGAGVGALSVLRDGLLELEHPLAEVIAPHVTRPLPTWLGDLDPLMQSGALTIDWLHGCARAVELRATTRPQLETIAQLGAHALTHLTSSLTITSTFSTKAAVSELAELLARQTLPWLEHLRIENVDESLHRALERAIDRRQLPRLNNLELVPRTRLQLVRHDASTLRLPFDGHEPPTQLTNEGVIHARGVAPTLSVTSPNAAPAHVFFNGRAVWPTEGDSTFRMLLRAGDTFALGGRAYRVVDA